MINLPIKPDILLHFNNDRKYDVYKAASLKTIQPQYAPLAKFGKSAGMVNTDSAIRLINTINTNKSFTVSYWMYDTTQTVQQFQMFFNKGPTAMYAGICYGYYDPRYNLKRLMCLSSKEQTNGCDDQDLNATTASLDSNVWVHIEISYNADTKTVNLFRNGILLISKAISYFISQITKNLIFYYTGTMYIDEVLLIQTVMHTSNFTPPTEPYYWSGTSLVYNENNLYGNRK